MTSGQFAFVCNQSGWSGWSCPSVTVSVMQSSPPLWQLEGDLCTPHSISVAWGLQSTCVLRSGWYGGHSPVYTWYGPHVDRVRTAPSTRIG